MSREEEVLDFASLRTLKSALAPILRKRAEEETGLEYKAVFSDITYVVEFPSAEVSVKRNPLYIFGRYEKRKQWVSQKRWKKYEESVEALIAEKFSKILSFGRYFMHASGREDVDALNTAGRPFVMELQEPSTYAPELSALDRGGEVSVRDLCIVDGSFVNLVTDSHFDKCYRAYLSKELSVEGQERVKRALEGTTVSQRTPTRVAHRRADKWRKRKVYSISFGDDKEGFYADICGEAGLYIKELISGDNGRTKPSFSSALGFPLECTKLIVTKINDVFLDEMLREKYGCSPHR